MQFLHQQHSFCVGTASVQNEIYIKNMNPCNHRTRAILLAAKKMNRIDNEPTAGLEKPKENITKKSIGPSNKLDTPPEPALDTSNEKLKQKFAFLKRLILDIEPDAVLKEPIVKVTKLDIDPSIKLDAEPQIALHKSSTKLRRRKVRPLKNLDTQPETTLDESNQKPLEGSSEDSGSDYVVPSTDDADSDTSASVQSEGALTTRFPPVVTRNRNQVEVRSEDELEESGSNSKINAKEKNKRVKRKLKHYCKFCDLEVHNFARHLQRQHYDEFEVKKFNHLEKKNPLRKQLIDKIRKEGDFIQGTLVPVQDKHRGETNKNDILPCIHCKGYYLKSSLRRHIKRCHFNNAVGTSRRYQAEAQTLLAQNFGPNDPLRSSGVLNSLQADNISLVAKKDKIICELARRYLKCHRDKHLIIVAKRNMRRLARLLIEVRKIENNNKLTLLCILHPSKFKSLIAATKSIGEYDANTRTFNSPSLALQMGTLLKKAIDAAYSLVLQKDINSPLLNVLNITKKIIIDDWSTEISTEAGQNLQVKKFNKPTVIPVTEDLAKMKNYLDNLVLTSKLALDNDNKSEKAYRVLIESTYCNLLLFNRRRVGELQRIPLQTYAKHTNTTSPGEFEKLLTPSEKVLISNLKRVVIRGKRGRGVPVLFDNSTQEGIETAIKHRQNFFKNINNVYLFGLANTENPLSGYQVFRKHVTKALGDPKKTIALTSTKLRKHLATISQILNMKDGDLEQLASFMGHTLKTHSEWYRLPSDIYQTAKVSKLLLISQGNEFDKYKGKNLDQIEVDNEVEEGGVDSGTDTGSDEDVNVENHKDHKKNTEGNESELPGTSQSKKKQKIVRKGWSEEEKRVTEKYFMKNIRNKIPPKKEEVIKLMEKYPKLFKGRTWAVVKAYVYNQYSKN